MNMICLGIAVAIGKKNKGLMYRISIGFFFCKNGFFCNFSSV